MQFRLIDTNLVTIEGKDVLFSTRTGQSYGLNETAARMLRMSLEMTAEQVADQLAREYTADRAELLEDVNELMRELVALKMAQRVPQAG